VSPNASIELLLTNTFIFKEVCAHVSDFLRICMSSIQASLILKSIFSLKENEGQMLVVSKVKQSLKKNEYISFFL
jgi:hypothetical protein